MSTIKNQKGFTLVELMVVVAIIGILSAIAVPQFRRYQAKSKTTEAKVNLASVYTAEISHFTDTDLYSPCLNAIGFQPGGTVTDRFYTVGFGNGGGQNTVATGGIACNFAADETHFIGTKGFSTGFDDAIMSANDELTQGVSFTVVAVGILLSGGTSDIWTVNQDKTITNVQRGF